MINKTPSPSIYESWNDVYINNNVWELPWVSKEIHPELKKVIDSLPIKTGNALDVGCGLGQVSRYLAQVGFDVTAIDISEEAIRLSKELNDTGKHIDYRVANSIHFQCDKKFDLIVDFLHLHDIMEINIDFYLALIESNVSLNGYFIVSTFVDKKQKIQIINKRESYFYQGDIYFYPEEFIIKNQRKSFVLCDKLYFYTGIKPFRYFSYALILKKTK